MAGTWWRSNRSRLLLSVVLAGGLALIVFGFVGAVTGPAQSGLPIEIERIQPERGDKVLSQSAVVADLIAGYGGRLEIDGLVLPTVSTQQGEPGPPADTAAPGGPTTTAPAATTTPRQPDDPDAVRFDAGSSTLTFQPRPGAVIERFSVGRHIVRVVYWKLTEGEASSFSYTWYFDVTA